MIRYYSIKQSFANEHTNYQNGMWLVENPKQK